MNALPSRHLLFQFTAFGVLALGCLHACDCIAPPVKEQLRDSAVVFSGKVTDKRELSKMSYGRRRYEVHFSVAKLWKGPDSSEFVIYDAQPSGDCQGFGFENGREYVVFVRDRIVRRDHTLFDLWSDILPLGTNILVGEICTRTIDATTARARQVIRELGRPRRSM